MDKKLFFILGILILLLPLVFSQSRVYAIDVKCGGHHACALFSNGDVICWGSKRYGQSENVYGMNATDIDVGYDVSCLLTNDGNVYCWGRISGYVYTGGDVKKFGFVAYTPSPYERYSDFFWFLFKNNSLYFMGSIVYTGDDIKEVVDDDIIVYVLFNNGTIYYYFNLVDYVESGYLYTGGDAIKIARASDNPGIYCFLVSNGTLYCAYTPFYSYYYDYPSDLKPFIVDRNIKDISITYYRDICLLFTNNTVKCINYDDPSQPTWLEQDGEYYALYPYEGRDVYSISTGIDFACVLTFSSYVYCWGDNYYGQSILRDLSIKYNVCFNAYDNYNNPIRTSILLGPYTFRTQECSIVKEGVGEGYHSPFWLAAVVPANYTFVRWESTGGIYIANPNSLETYVNITDDGNITVIFQYSPGAPQIIPVPPVIEALLSIAVAIVIIGLLIRMFLA